MKKIFKKIFSSIIVLSILSSNLQFVTYADDSNDGYVLNGAGDTMIKTSANLIKNGDFSEYPPVTPSNPFPAATYWNIAFNDPNTPRDGGFRSRATNKTKDAGIPDTLHYQKNNPDDATQNITLENFDFTDDYVVDFDVAKTWSAVGRGNKNDQEYTPILYMKVGEGKTEDWLINNTIFPNFGQNYFQHRTGTIAGNTIIANGKGIASYPTVFTIHAGPYGTRDTDDFAIDNIVLVQKKYKYKIVFKNDGTEISNNFVKGADTIIAPTEPTKTGFRFLGWKKEGTSEYFANGTLATAPATYIADWERVGYSVNYDFVAEDNTTLPTAVTDQKPANLVEQNNGEKIIPKTNFTPVEDTDRDGSWNFVSWDANEKTINNADLSFVGTWKFVPNKHNVTHSFASATDGKNLPNNMPNVANITDKIKGDVVTPAETSFAEVIDATNDGKWNFISWTPETITINNSDANFVGKWNFTPNKYEVTFSFEKSANTTKDLPTGVTAKLPEKISEKINGENISAPTISGNIEEDDGTWTFEGWDENQKTINKANVNFVGKWLFTPSIVSEESKKLDNYVKVTFVVDQDKGETSSTKIFYVNPTKNVTLVTPAVTNKIGYTFSGWDKSTSGTFSADTTITANFNTTAIDVTKKTINLSSDTSTDNSGTNITISPEEFVTNKDLLPTGVVFSWKDNITPKVYKNSLNKQTPTIVAKIGEHILEEKQVTINFVDDIAPTIKGNANNIITDNIADIVAIRGEAITEKLIVITDNIEVEDIEIDGLPSGIDYDEENQKFYGTPDNTNKFGDNNSDSGKTEKDYTVTITAKDKSNNTTTKTFKITLKAQSTKYSPETTKQIKEVTTNISAEDSITNKSSLPTGTTYSWKVEPNKNKIAKDVTATVIVTYPDGSTDEVEAKLDIVDTTKPTIEGDTEKTLEVGSDEANNFTISSGLTAKDNYDNNPDLVDNTNANLIPNCTSTPEYNSKVVGTYNVVCTTTDISGNTSENFTRIIKVEQVDKTKLQELLNKITEDFNNKSDKITNPDTGNSAKTEIQEAINNPNLTKKDLEKILEKFKNTSATRDEVPPTGTITAENVNGNTDPNNPNNTSSPTNGDVKLTLIVEDDSDIKDIDGWTRDPNNPKKFTKIFTENTPVSVEVTDKYGNKNTITHNITNIDKIIPICGTFNLNPTTPTNGVVTATMTNMSDADSGLKDGQNYTCNVTENNTSCNITIFDKAGNSAVCTSPVVTNIDKTAPSGEITGEPENWTNSNVVLTLNTTKPVETPDGWTKVSDTKFTKIIEANSTGEVTLVDNAGNSSAKIKYNVDKIDKEKPVVTKLEIEGNKTLIRDASVKVNFSGKDTGGSKIKHFECSLNNGEFVLCGNGGDNSKDAEFIFTNLVEGVNTLKVRVIDNAGNTSEDRETTITKDTTAPNFTNLENKDYPEKQEITPFTISTDDPLANISIKNNLPDGLVYNPDTKTISGTPTKPGSYKIEVEAVDTAGNKTTKEINITIKDKTPPNITLNGQDPISIIKGKPYTEPGATCSDNVDTTCSVVITGDVDTNTIGDYTITYTATDAAGNKTTTIITRTVKVVSGDDPIITLTGNSVVEVELGSDYTDQGATAEDQEDGDITANIVTTNNVELTNGKALKLGEYNVVYNVTDSSGNKATEVERKVIVKDTTEPNIENIPNKEGLQNTDITPIAIKVTDLNPVLNISVENLPNGLEYNPITKQIEGKTGFVGEVEIKVIAIDGSGNKSEKPFKLKITQPRNNNNSSNGGSGAGGGASGNSVSPAQPTNPNQNNTNNSDNTNNNQNDNNRPNINPNTKPNIIDQLPSQNKITPTGKTTASNQKIFDIDNRVTDYICPQIVQAYTYPNLVVEDNPISNPFHDDISALMMFRGMEKDEMNLGQTYKEYEKYGVVLNVEHFEPTRNVTRAEFVKMLVRSLSCRYTYMGTDTGFSDVEQNKWYAEYIKFAVENNWINGYKDGTFRPNNPITRDEAAKILSNAIHLTVNKANQNNTKETSFSDIEKDSEFIPYIETLKEKGIMKGRNATTFSPKSNIPRTETSRIVYRTFFGGSN